ncbi:MAG: hypothetical protein K0Q72_654 [Armatimonadetes bacterium]|jgi:hypothetical protein|nr:hypothetical protein [Armatimonadota bacterium]
MSRTVAGTILGGGLGLLAGGGFAYWYVMYGERLLHPGYDPSHNYAAGAIILAAAVAVMVVGALAGLLLGRGSHGKGG